MDEMGDQDFDNAGSMEWAVQRTADSASMSKGSLHTLGYFDDIYITCLTQEARRSPLINRGYYVRAQAINQSLMTFLQSFKGQSKQIISLGAGFDSAYFRLHGHGHLKETVFFEVDFPSVVRSKAMLIGKTLHSRLEEAVYLPEEADSLGSVEIRSKWYNLLGTSLDNLENLHGLLARNGCDFNKPTLLLSECVMTYMDVERSDKLIKYCAETFPNGVFISYEQVHPNDPFGRVMMGHFKKIHSPLKAIEVYPTPEHHRQRFLKLGWCSPKVVDMNQFYASLDPEERERVDNIEPFDEFEEWHLQCSHYILVTAAQGSCLALSPEPTEPLPSKCDREPHRSAGTLEANYRSIIHDQLSVQKCGLFGHSCVKSASDLLLIGGFGVYGSGHGRHQGAFRVDLSSGEMRGPIMPQIAGRMYHTMNVINGNRILVFGGRKSPLVPCDHTPLIRQRGGKSGMQASYGVAQHNIPDREGAYKPLPRWRHSATTIPHKDQEAVLIYGGKNLTSVFNDCAVFTIEQGWSQVRMTSGQVEDDDSNSAGSPSELSASLPEARHSHTATLWGQEQIIVACGLGADGRPLNSIITLQCVSWIWRPFKSVPTIKPRYSHTAHIINDHLLLVGGVHLEGSVIPSITRISLSTGCWQEFELMPADPERILMVHSHESVIDEGDLLIVGGGGNCFSFGTHFNKYISSVSLPDDWLITQEDVDRVQAKVEAKTGGTPLSSV